MFINKLVLPLFMAENDWTTTSVKLERAMKKNLDTYCSKENTTPNKFLRSLIEKKLRFMTDSNSIRKDKGIPLLAKHEFEYNVQTDKFDWILDFNENNKQILSKNISIDFLEKLKKSIDKAIKKQEMTIKKQGDKTIVPADVLDYEVEE